MHEDTCACAEEAQVVEDETKTTRTPNDVNIAPNKQLEWTQEYVCTQGMQDLSFEQQQQKQLGIICPSISPQPIAT